MQHIFGVVRPRFASVVVVIVWFCIMLWVVDVLLSVLFLLGSPQSMHYWCLLDVGVTVGLGAMVFVLWKLWGLTGRTDEAAIEQALRAERSRIAHELHDGLGFQLVNTLCHARENQQGLEHIRKGLEQALIDLHVVIDGIESEDIGVLDRMADLRYRIQPALDRQGITLRWNMPQALAGAPLPGVSAKHLAKITQEALSNTVQHATATEVEVSLQQLDAGAGLVLRVLDDGCGIQAQRLEHQGRGLAGMQRRAQLMGATLQFTPGLRGSGTGICVHVLPVPLPRRAPDVETQDA